MPTTDTMCTYARSVTNTSKRACRDRTQKGLLAIRQAPGGSELVHAHGVFRLSEA